MKLFYDINFPTTLPNYKDLNFAVVPTTNMALIGIKLWLKHLNNDFQVTTRAGLQHEADMGKFQVADMDVDMHVFTKP